MIFLLLFSLKASAGISPQAIREQISLTQQTSLKNEVNVVLRQAQSSKVLVIQATFKFGVRDLPVGSKSYALLMPKFLSVGSKKFPKGQLFKVLEKNNIDFECEGGIESTNCMIATVSDQMPLAMSILRDGILNPAFTSKDFELLRSRLLAEQKSTLQNSEKSVNDLVNSVFYGDQHAYSLSAKMAISELSKATLEDVKRVHQQLIKELSLNFVVVSSLPNNKILTNLATAFGGLNHIKSARKKVENPVYENAHDFSYEDRDVPTAYVRTKFNIPLGTPREYMLGKLFFEILSEEMWQEIRTKRSLSYSAFASPIFHSIGVGMISLSTPKPEEALVALAQIIQKMRSQPLGVTELNEFKMGFTTSYFLNLESHGSLAAALSEAVIRFGDVKTFYELPKELESITGENIQKYAMENLKNFRTGVVFGKDKFKSDWVVPIHKYH